MVTIFAMVHYSRRAAAPAKLYEEVVEVLLTEVPYAGRNLPPGCKAGAGWIGRTCDWLACIAFELHERQRSAVGA
jgi:hypothetical protein